MLTLHWTAAHPVFLPNAPNKPKTRQTETLQPGSGGPRPLQVWRPPSGGRQLRRAAYPMPSVGRGTGCAVVQRSVSMVVDSAAEDLAVGPAGQQLSS